jgi:hypothetical protein
MTLGEWIGVLFSCLSIFFSVAAIIINAKIRRKMREWDK